VQAVGVHNCNKSQNHSPHDCATDAVTRIGLASMIIMSNMIETLLLRNLQEVFGEGDPERRRSAIEQLYTEDCVVNLPVGQYHGYDTLDRICGELRASHPSYVYTPHNAPIVVQDG
jgi:hypothetical protein